MAPMPMREPLFIVGMYKSGTSWLLRILDQHPMLRGVKEIDLISAGAGKVVNGDTLLTQKERLFSYFSANAWAALPKDLSGNMEATAILLKNTGTESISSIFDLPAEQAIDTILKLYDLKLKQGKPEWAPNEKRQLLSIVDVPRPSLIALYHNIAAVSNIYDAGNAFLETMYSVVGQGCTLIFKGADLIARYGYLKKWKPRARKFLIVRDGRDVAISTMHYRQLMRSVKRTNVRDEDDYWGLFSGWCNRVRILMEMASDENLAIIRYEDLILDFTRTVAALFHWLDMPVDDTTLNEIYQATSFETLTDRKRGQSAPHLLRRGMIGEWKQALSLADCQKAWQAASRELAFLGYTETGMYEPLNIAGALSR
ncbi:MAG: sulfotransferase domain-containing protein [Gammaproteobacteria bacterium]